MSRTHRDLNWSIIIQDYQHWSKEHFDAWDKSETLSFDDWVTEQLALVMQKAGEQFIKDNPDLFAGELI